MADIANPTGDFRVFFEDTSPCTAATVPQPAVRTPARMRGAIVRAYGEGRDLALIELLAIPPFTATFANLKFTREGPGTLFVIHHLWGTTKRIAFGNNTGGTQSFLKGQFHTRGWPTFASSGGHCSPTIKQAIP